MAILVSATISWLLMILLNATLAEFNITYLDTSEGESCIRCLCEFRGSDSCARDRCEGPEGRQLCGPFLLSQPFWIDGGSLTVPGENATSQTRMFQNCALDYNCSVDTMKGYFRRYQKDCNEDDKFTCVDMSRLFFLGPNCQGHVHERGREGIERVTACFAALTGNTTWGLPTLKRTSPAENGAFIILYVCIGLVVIFVLASVMVIYVLYRNRQRMIAQRDGMPSVRQIVRKTKVTPDDVKITIPLSIIIQPTELSIRQDKVLGQGHFGVVYEGTFNGTPVAVKEPKLNLLNMAATKEFEKELEMMANVGKHQYVVEFFGAEISKFKKGIVHVVLELSRYGSLLDVMRGYAKQHQIKLDESKLNDHTNLRPGTPGVSDLSQGLYKIRLRWSYQIASGMAYLESKKIMHGDLAARNVLLFDLELVKLSDFGFARNLENYDEYMKSEGPMPWRWMAPESLERRIFSTKSDVWAFAVTLWEVFTFGVVPNGGLQYCTPEYFDGLKKGDRLVRPEGATTEIYTLMLDCWKLEADSRPTFACLENYLLNLFNYYNKAEAVPNEYQEFGQDLMDHFQSESKKKALDLDSK